MTQHFDVLIIGAGLSGIGAAHHLQEQHPEKTFALIESRERMGGTWDLFRYPGIRSDSDMHTLGFGFRPWPENTSIVAGDKIRQYLLDTAAEDGTDQHVIFGKRVVHGSWSSETGLWTADLKDSKTGEIEQVTCNFVISCTGYYDYEQGFTPDFPGKDRFKGQIVHPQQWPEDLDYAGKKVVVIGSGATAITLIPSMAEEAGHITMLQRSPSYVLAAPQEDPIAANLRRVMPDRFAMPAVRWKNVLVQSFLYNFSQKQPKRMRAFLKKRAEVMLPKDFDVDTHFNPKYNPWDERLCIAPRGDFFKAIRKGDASIVTDHIKTFTEDGIELESGDHLDADIIITATGLNLLLLGGITADVDGVPVDHTKHMAYKGLMLEGVPNFAFAIGYTNASWTLKADLTGEYVCRLIDHMDKNGFDQVMPIADDPTIVRRPLLDFQAGYVLRSMDQLPQQGDRGPWRVPQNYIRDVFTIRRSAIDDGNLRFAKKTGAKTKAEGEKAAAAA